MGATDMDRHKETTETKEEKEEMKWLYNITDNIDIWVQRRLKKRPKQASYEWYQDNIPHKLGDQRIGAALGVNKDDIEEGKIHRPKRRNKRKKKTVVRGMADKTRRR
tara:strand:+ start:369 stop:689 length:321 start_codon:yes stop_codon:yes gene_type:complete